MEFIVTTFAIKAASLALTLLCAPALYGNIFLKECENPSSPEVARTVEALRTLSEEATCEEAFRNLSEFATFDLKEQGLTDISVLAAFPKASWLLLGKSNINVDNNKIANLKVLAELPELTHLRAEKNGLTALPASLPLQLSFIDVSGNAIEDVSAPGELRYLQILDFTENKISQVPTLEMPYLSYAAFGWNRITEIPIISTKAPGEGDRGPFLSFNHNKITAIAPGLFPPHTDAIALGGNALTDIAFLSYVRDLTKVGLGENSIADLSPLANLYGLTTIHAEKNRIEDISPLANLSKLKELVISENPFGTSTKKTQANCPTDAMSPAVAKWCAEAL